MEMVKAEFEIFLIPESVCLPFEGFDFVVDAFDNGAGDRVLEVVEQAGPIRSQCLGDFGQVFDSGPECVRAPGFQESSCGAEIFLFPKESELFLHGMDCEEGLVGLKQSVEPGLPVRFEVLVVGQQQETFPFEGLLPQLIKLALLFSAKLFDGVINESHDMVAVKDNVDMRHNPSHSGEIGTAHVHGHSLKLLSLSGQLFQKRADIFFAFSFHRMKDSSTPQISNDGHVLVAFPDTELVNTDVADLVKGDGPIEKAQFGFMDVLDQVPAHSKVVGNPADGPEAEEIQNGKGKGTYIPMLSRHEWQPWPPKRGTIDTSQAMKIKDQDTFLATNGAHEEPPGLPALHDGFAATALGTLDQRIGHLGAQNHRIGVVVSRCIADTLQPKGVVQYRCGHGLEPPV